MKHSHSMGAVILVGGQGTRLRPLTLHRPKALMPILNKPFLSYQFALLKKAGIRHVVLAANPAFKKWKKELQKACPSGLKLHFAFEPKPLGTGGAIRFGYERLVKETKTSFESVVVMNGDVLIDFELKKVLAQHKKQRSACTIVLTFVPDVSRFGLVKTDRSGRVKAFLEKPKTKKGGAINAGVYVMQPDVILSVEPDKVVSVERETFPVLLSQKERVFGQVVRGYWNDIGTPATYLQAHKDLLKRKSIWTEKRNLCIGNDPYISKSVHFQGSVALGSRVVIEKNCIIKDSVILDKVKIEEGSSLDGVIVGSRCHLGKFSTLSPGTVFGDGTKTLPYTRT